MCSLWRKCYLIRLCAVLSGLGILVCSAGALPAADAPDTLNIPAVSAEREAWLVTYGPGEIYWQRFGHNAIWLREPARGLDHTFNFGYFDFAQQNFFLRFLRGRMLYFSLAQPASGEFRMYRLENRGITAQKLNLLPEQYLRLRDYLLDEVRPVNREYQYDYYLNNCSTRIRDALDLALDGALSAQFLPQPAAQNFRAHTRRLTSMDFWYYLGLETGLGSPVDRPNSRWEEMFIPSVLEESMEQLSLRGTEASGFTVSARHEVFAADGVRPPATPPTVWSRYLFMGFSLAVAAWLAGRFLSPLLLRGLALTWVMAAATGGLVLAGLWGLTDHHAAGANLNVLLFNPLFWIALLPKARRAAVVLLVGGVGITIVLASIPGGQYNLDVLALTALLNLGSAHVLWRGTGLRARPGFSAG